MPDEISHADKLRAARVIFCVEAAVVQAPFIDGAPVEIRHLAQYTTQRAGIAAARGKRLRRALDLDAGTEQLLFVQVVTRALDVGRVDYWAHLTLSPAGQILERLELDDEIEHWKGRPPSTYRWSRGDIAACVFNGRYRIGVVLARPHTAQWCQRQARPGLTRADDVYLLGFAGDESEHHHPSEAVMFEPIENVPRGLRRRLTAGWREHPALVEGVS